MIRYLCTVCRRVKRVRVSGTPRRVWFRPCTCRRHHTPHHVFERFLFTGRWA